LILAEWDFVPLLTEYVNESENPLEKRFEAFSALMVLQKSTLNANEEARKRILREEIRRLALEDQDFARKASDSHLGLVEALVIRKILGEEIPSDIPNWMLEEIAKRT
jgi:hypothetical protein